MTQNFNSFEFILPRSLNTPLTSWNHSFILEMVLLINLYSSFTHHPSWLHTICYTLILIGTKWILTSIVFRNMWLGHTLIKSWKYFIQLCQKMVKVFRRKKNENIPYTSFEYQDSVLFDILIPNSFHSSRTLACHHSRLQILMFRDLRPYHRYNVSGRDEKRA